VKLSFQVKRCFGYASTRWVCQVLYHPYGQVVNRCGITLDMLRLVASVTRTYNSESVAYASCAESSKSQKVEGKQMLLQEPSFQTHFPNQQFNPGDPNYQFNPGDPNQQFNPGRNGQFPPQGQYGEEQQGFPANGHAAGPHYMQRPQQCQ
jgi:hypothetical protein